MFEIKNVSKQFDKEYALHDVSMVIGCGLNFIIGASGSGKTTLLKIISGMEPSFEGEALFCGQNINKMSEREKSNFYNNVFGFVWQDFNLIDDWTVLENILLPQYLKTGLDGKAAANRVLRELKISELKYQKIGKLSGGQKQRVAIARELMKDPQVILADEPTSALDEESAQNTMDILRGLSKTRIVIVVTHDTALIDNRSTVYELDKGELVLQPNLERTRTSFKRKYQSHLSLGDACKLGITFLKRKCGRAVTTGLSLLTAATLLLVAVSGAITDSSQAAFDELFSTYGDSLMDITVADSFMSAGGTNGEQRDEPNADVSQNIDGLYEKYSDDDRVTYVLFAQPFDNIKIKVHGKDYTIESSNNVPVINHLVAGSMPMGVEKEVIVPEGFVKTLGITNEQAIGKEIEFSGTVNDWESGEPIETPMQTTVKIVGVIDTTIISEYGGKTYEYSIDDSFFFSPAAMNAMREGAGMEPEPGIFYIRCKTPADLIAIKDELNASGIVPLGRFELVEDMVRLKAQTNQQSNSAMVVIGILSVVVVLAIASFNAMLRRREYAICKVSGFSKLHLAKATLMEFLLLTTLTCALFLTLSPLLNLATTAFWDVNILNGKMLLTGVLLTALTGVLSCAVTTAIGVSTNASDALKAGDR